MDWVLMFLPMGLQTLAMRLIAKDQNATGSDDAIGQLLLQLSPLIPDLIQNRTPNDSATDRAFFAVYKVAESYLRQRGKLPVAQPDALEVKN